MDKKTFRSTSSFIVFKLFLLVLFFHSALSAPLNSSSISYDAFLRNVTKDNCTFPSGIVLPIQNSTSTFEYFSELLKICKAPEDMKRSLEAVALCKEIYDALRNITCLSNKNVELPEIKIEFSDNVCRDINSLQLQQSLEEKSMLQHLTDKFICDIMCDADFLPACKVLLWSYQLRKRIEGIPFVQLIQTPNNQENTADIGTPNVKLQPSNKDYAIDKVQESLNPDDIPAEENPVNKMGEDQGFVNEDTGKNELDDHTLKISKDKQTNDGENEIPEEPIISKKKGNELVEEQDQATKLEEPKQPDKIENEAVKTKEAVEAKTEKEVHIIKPITENKIDVDALPPKNSESLHSKTKVVKNHPAVPIPEVNDKAVHKNVTTAQNNLLPESPKENLVKMKPTDATNDNLTSNNLKPVTNNELNKLQDVVPPLTQAKTTIEANVAKVSLKPETTLPKDEEEADNKLIPTIGKEDVATDADLEKMEEGNGIPEPADKDPALYKEDGLFDSAKNKKDNESDGGKISKPALAENEPPKYDVLPPRNFGRGSGDILSTFPEQEDSHFFFYFLSLVLILMAGYLLFHNKQKIIALIVEGRHERRRRSHGLGYKKLETK